MNGKFRPERVTPRTPRTVYIRFQVSFKPNMITLKLRNILWEMLIYSNSSIWEMYIFLFEAGNVVSNSTFNPSRPAFTIVISIHYKPRIAVAILDMLWMKMTRSGLQIEKNIFFIKQLHENWCSKTPTCTDVSVGNNLIFQRCKMML